MPADVFLLVKVLSLLAVANGAPVVGQKVLGNRLRFPLDAGASFIDGRPLLGRSKTIRGVLLSLVSTAAAGWLLGPGIAVGATVAFFAMLGDATSSFIKRRLGLPSSGMLLGVDQIPESLFPLLALEARLGLTVDDILILVAVFMVLELLLSRVLFELHLRDQPY